MIRGWWVRLWHLDGDPAAKEAEAVAQRAAAQSKLMATARDTIPRAMRSGDRLEESIRLALRRVQ
jgi:hypothetical protein